MTLGGLENLVERVASNDLGRFRLITKQVHFTITACEDDAGFVFALVGHFRISRLLMALYRMI